MTWAERPTLGDSPGEAINGTFIESVLDQIETLTTSVEGEWSTWTPALTNLTLGNGSVVARYKAQGKTVHYRFRFTMGSTSAVGTSPRFTLPVAPVTSVPYVTFQEPFGDGNLLDSGTANRRGQVIFISGSTVEVLSFSTTGVLTTITATVPQTWATGDVIAVTGVYESV